MWLLVAIKKSDERFSFHENNYSLLANKLFLNRIIREKKTPFNVFAHHFNDFIVKWKCTSMICRRCGFGWLPVRKGCRDKNQFVHICAQFSFPHIYFSLLANYFNNEEEFRIYIWNCFGKKKQFHFIFSHSLNVCIDIYSNHWNIRHNWLQQQIK